MKRPLAIGVGILLFIGAITTAVAFSVASDLRAVKDILDRDTRELDADRVEEARSRLQRARDRLDSLPARMLRIVPIVGQNLGSLHGVVDASIPTLQAGLDLNDAVSELEEGGLIANGRIRIGALDRLRGPVGVQIAAMATLVDRLEKERNGWLAPPLWNAFDGFLERANTLLHNARRAGDLLDLTDELLGRENRRTYLVLLLNNAELRGAGGLLSGVGTVEVDGGRIRLGGFRSVHDLQDDPPRPVRAPREYERRFGVFDANTTLWLNTSYSPDVPDVAVVASRLYRLKTGQSTDGAVVIDPRGVAALLPSDEDIDLPGMGLEVPVEESTDFIYSDAYEIFTDQETRRDAVLAFGTAAFEEVLEDGLGGEEVLRDLADAMGGGHLRFISFDGREKRVLDDLGATGELSLQNENAHGLLVTVQNFGGGNRQGNKLDFWARRSISHECEIDKDDPFPCVTTTTLANRAPRGLPTYVAGRDGVLRSYLETYIPADSRLISVDMDGEPVQVRTEEQAGRTSVAAFVRVPRGERTRVRVAYELPPADPRFDLIVDPQPLTHDARLEVRLGLPRGWVAEGAGEPGDDGIAFEGALDHPLRFSAYRDPRTGIPGLWQRLSRFWSEPIF